MTGGAGASISNGRYNQLKRLLPYLKVESEDCLYLNLYVPRLGEIFIIIIFARVGCDFRASAPQQQQHLILSGA